MPSGRSCMLHQTLQSCTVEFQAHKDKLFYQVPGWLRFQGVIELDWWWMGFCHKIWRKASRSWNKAHGFLTLSFKEPSIALWISLQRLPDHSLLRGGRSRICARLLDCSGHSKSPRLCTQLSCPTLRFEYEFYLSRLVLVRSLDIKL